MQHARDGQRQPQRTHGESKQPPLNWRTRARLQSRYSGRELKYSDVAGVGCVYSRAAVVVPTHRTGARVVVTGSIEATQASSMHSNRVTKRALRINVALRMQTGNDSFFGITEKTTVSRASTTRISSHR